MNPAAALEAPVPFYLAASVDIAAADTTPGSKRKVTGVAYSGEVVTHPWAGRVVFDLSTTNAPDKMPLLVEHDRAQRAGVGKLSINDDNITVDDGYLLPNVAGNAVAADADAGFPWQLSVHIQPGVVDTIGTGENATVNGKKVEGPLSIFRNSLIREVSFTPTGVDANTSAAVFSARAVTAPALTKDPAMSEQNLNEAVAAAIKPVQASLDAATANVTTVTAERDAALAELEKLRTENAKVATEARLSAVKSLFSDTGREFSDAAAAPYLAMTGEVFSAIEADLRATKAKTPTLNPALFSHTATAGKEAADVGEPFKFSAAIQQRIKEEAAKGNDMTVVQAALAIKSEQAAA